MVDPDAHRGQLVDLRAADEGSPAPGDGTQFSDRFPIACDDECFPCRHGLDHFRVVIPQFALRDCPCHRPSVAVSATVRYSASAVPLLRDQCADVLGGESRPGRATSVTTQSGTVAHTSDMRWIVDAMNVIGARPDGWWRNRQAAMVALVRHLERWAATQRQQVTVVFEQPTVCESAVIRVAHAPTATINSADDEIMRLLEADDHPGHITVVTSDATLARRVRDAGASVQPARTFRNLIDPLPR